MLVRLSVARPSLAARLAQVGPATLAAAGCALLAARPLIIPRLDHPFAGLVVLFSALLIVGLVAPLPSPITTSTSVRLRRTHTTLFALAVGVGAFGLGRILGGGRAPLPFVERLVLLNSLAAVAEEAFYRRFVFGRLALIGERYAVVGSGVLFAIVHVTVYGWWVLPLDLAAGVLLSWQRAVTGSWLVPAVTHVTANVFVLW